MSDILSAQAERDALPAVGPKFFRDEAGTVMFQFVLDATNVVGPRPATAADVRNHGEAFRRLAPISDAEFAQMGFTKVPTEPPMVVRELPPGVLEAFNGADPAAFDHDGDGKPGGSLPHTSPEFDEPMVTPPIATVIQVPPRSPRRSSRRG